MHIYRFRFNNSKKNSILLFWFFTALLTIPLTGTTIVLLPDLHPLFPAWLLLILLPLTLIAIYNLVKLASRRQSAEIISLSNEGFSSSCFGSVLFSEINCIRVPVREIRLLGGLPLDYYNKTDVNIPYLEFSITTYNGKKLKWVLNEWGGLYNAEEEFLIFFNFLTALTDKLYQLYYANKSFNCYLKILDENGSWEKSRLDMLK
ncbi:hypothetical protein HDC90_000446 [Pedobacter sp. AK013]|uniref:hypothetical protein n=1 Tax=Pedobacter sp. AK013 TaxID=2723071 RepID=UPI001607E5AF|nr:hypothetical protein [Pedobacter sp. AK013]MBB6235846.1 hypothetical protein [Pedobacter sp. AK013]